MIKSELAMRRAHHPKLLSLQQVDASCSSADDLTAPMTPLASSSSGDAAACASVFSPRDPTTKLLATKDGASASASCGFSSHRLSLPSPTGSSAGDEDEDEDAAGKSGAVKPNTGRWTEAEHQLFLQGLETFPYRAWKKIATLIKTRTVVQIRTHAQKYYQKLEKEEARLKEREQQGPGPSHPHPSLDLPSTPLSAPFTPLAGPQCGSPSSQQQRRPLLRKRKCPPLPSLDAADGMSEDDVTPLPSLPKRMMREKKAAAAHMSPKQKAPMAANKLFADMLDAAHPQPAPRGGLAAFARHQHNAVLLTPSKAPHPMHQMHQMHQMQMLPLDFGDEDDAAAAGSSDAMMLDLSDEKALVDLPYPLDAVGLDTTLSSIDNDDLLQLTEEELDWFSSDASASPASVLAADRTGKDEDAFALGRFPFPAASEEDDECLRLGDELAMADPLSCAPSPGLVAAAAVFADEDDDFVLDPEKFLSSYFTTSQC